jgi:polyisoprenoid-binding protein YceI
MTFKSTKVNFRGDVPATVEGNLTLLGVTKPVTLNIDAFKCGQHPMNKKDACGFDASAQIKRSDFGMKYGIPNIGDEVKLTIDVEAHKE